MNPIALHRPDEWSIYEPLHGDSMLELGAKWCSQADVTYKKVFEALGYRHVSVDWNAKHGALNRDLRKPLWAELGQFDMVTNMGCTEHVDGQAGVWENIHRMTKVGGVYVGQTPYHDGKSWWWHGTWYPTEDFFTTFALYNDWYLERMYVDRDIPNQNLYVRMTKKSEADFKMPPLEFIKRNERRPR